ncbi:hypothetical protein AX16_000651 [Volvariella volvacea WC 439]|nr:hypothetical protein AX16_000651 [Volvariella volvacea WC 439]
MSTVTNHTTTAQPAERPERSRNAKAQARHRAKRKAYIEQLEQTVTKLQVALGFSPEQVAALPPPLVKIRELEQENLRLQKENEDLRRLLAETGHRVPLDIGRRNSLASFHESRMCDRDYKRRKMPDEPYGVADTDSLHRPPPLSIPQPLSHHYPGVTNGSHHQSNSTSNSLFNIHNSGFPLPNTPSASSSTSSPPFSPAQMQQTPAHSPVNHRPPVSNHHVMSNYAHPNHYGSVKVEDEAYVSSSHHAHNPNYPLPPYANGTSDNGLESWHPYSSERAPLHR